VLGAAQPDALGPRERALAAVLTGVGVRPDPQPAPLVGVPQQQIDGLYQVGGLLVGASSRCPARPACRSPPARHHRYLPEEHLPVEPSMLIGSPSRPSPEPTRIGPVSASTSKLLGAAHAGHCPCP